MIYSKLSCNNKPKNKPQHAIIKAAKAGNFKLMLEPTEAGAGPFAPYRKHRNAIFLCDIQKPGQVQKSFTVKVNKNHEEKREQLTQRREDIMREIENHNKAENHFSKTLISLVELASRALETFKGSTTEEKRKSVNLVFSNLELKGQKLVYTLRPPFDAFVKTTKTGEWCALEDSNL